MEGLIGISDHSNWHDFDFRIKKKSFEIGSRNVGCCRHWAPCACRRVGLSGKQVLILLFIKGTISRLYICQIQISHRCSGPRRLCSILEVSLVHIESSAYRHPSVSCSMCSLTGLRFGTSGLEFAESLKKLIGEIFP